MKTKKGEKEEKDIDLEQNDLLSLFGMSWDSAPRMLVLRSKTQKEILKPDSHPFFHLKVSNHRASLQFSISSDSEFSQNNRKHWGLLDGKRNNKRV
jgi:hypothetical protein